MNPTLRRFGASPRSCLPEWRLGCEARRARACVRSTSGQGSTRRVMRSYGVRVSSGKDPRAR
eukprot:6214328-Pleurochrysis_carterae.AAC.1